MWTYRQKKRNTGKLQNSLTVGWRRGKKMGREQIVQRNIPYHITSHPAINQGTEVWGFVFQYVHFSETDWVSVCLWEGFCLCKPTQHISYICKLLFLVPQVFLLSLILFSPLSCWSKWSSEQVAVGVSSS